MVSQKRISLGSALRSIAGLAAEAHPKFCVPTAVTQLSCCHVPCITNLGLNFKRRLILSMAVSKLAGERTHLQLSS